VACFHIAEYTGDEPVTINTAPNAVPGIVFQHRNGRSALAQITTRGGHYITPTLFLYGVGTEPSTMHYGAGAYTTIHVIFKPHALHSLLGLNAAVLHNSATELNEFATARLDEQLLAAPTVQDQVGMLIDFLLTRRAAAQTRDPAIEASLRQIHQHVATISVKQLRQTLHFSERQFERRFQQTVGISAQSYIRVKRFNEAVRLLKRGQQTKLTDIAHALHFYDQAHFIREVKAFANMTPKQLAQKTNDTYHEQVGYSHV
jgi:AraC-like DNA-binding protein